MPPMGVGRLIKRGEEMSKWVDIEKIRRLFSIGFSTKLCCLLK